MAKYYLLDANKIPYEVSLEESYKVYEDMDMKIVKQETVGDSRVSTVFLCLDHAWHGEDGPILFETMIFDGYYDEFQRRYKTYDEALQGHNDAVEMVNEYLTNLKNR